MEIIKIVQDGIELDVIGSVDASSITQDANNRFVTDVEKTAWNNKQDSLTAGTNVTITGTTISATVTKSDVGLGNVNNVAITAAQVTKINELNYTRAMTQAQYDALSTAEKNRTDVWYGIYK